MINRAIIEGFVADEPFVRATERGKVARIRVATVEHRPSSNSGKVHEIVEWHTVVFWGELADVVDEKLHAGMAIHTEGTLQTRQWEGKDGVKHRTTDIVASQLKILDGIEGYRLPAAIKPFVSERSMREAQNQSGSDNDTTPPPFIAPTDDIDELPF